MRRLLLTLTLALLIGTVATPLLAQEHLTQVALFHRCYSQLTQSRARRSDPLLAAVRDGTKSAIQACTEVLDRARFTADGGTKIQDDSDAVAKSVLFSLHQLHRSWSRQDQLFDPGDSSTMLGTQTWYEDNPLGAYVTRALFSPNVDVASVVTGFDYLQAVRTLMDPPHSYGGVPSSTVGRERDWALGADHPFAPQGDLLGIRTVTRAPIYTKTGGRFTSLSTIPDFANLGLPPTATLNLTNVNLTTIAAVQGPLTETTLFAIRIRGKFLVPSAGSYTLYLSVDDGGMLYVDGELVASRNSAGESSAPTQLSAGAHDLEIRYRQNSAGARLIFSWAGSGISKQVVPAGNFSDLVAEYYTESKPAPFQVTGNEGGGFIGNHNYLLTALVEADNNFTPNGAEKTNRSWTRAVLKDALCREVPVVREADVEQFVIPDSAVPFRQAATCSACHASLDRQAGVIRGLRFNRVASRSQTSPLPTLYGMFGVTMLKPALPSRTEWGDIPDPDYSLREPYGHFYFRNYRGELVDRIVHSVNELGSVISEQDDYYACFAKRYYHYFMGIDVDLGDPGDPTYPKLNAADTYHRNKVIELGLRLKSHRSLRQLILDIFNLEDYSRSDFAVSKKG